MTCRCWIITAVVVAAIAVLPTFLETEHMSLYRSWSALIGHNVNDGRTKVGEFDAAWDESATVESRASRIQSLVNQYYDIVTDFYEYGWGQCFHFAPRHRGEDFEASLARHEFSLVHKMNVQPGMKVLDVGCGVGGPARNIARFTGAQIVGLNNNEYQIGRANKATANEHLDNLCSFVHGDFMKMPFEDATFDAVYAIEATCHAPDKVGVYSEILRVLKPGGVFGVYEWTMTDRYDAKNETQRKIKLGIEHGDALPDLPHFSVVTKSMREAGFDVIESYDVAEEDVKKYGEFALPWYLPLDGHFTLTGFKHTPIGRWCTSAMVWVLETIGIAPKGSFGTAMMLEDAASNLVLGGRDGVFTPMYFVLSKKPAAAAKVTLPAETPKAPKAEKAGKKP